MVEALKGAGGGLALGNSGYRLCAERDGKPIEDAQQGRGPKRLGRWVRHLDEGSTDGTCH